MYIGFMTCSGFLYNLICITMETAMPSITHGRLWVNAKCSFTSAPGMANLLNRRCVFTPFLDKR